MGNKITYERNNLKENENIYKVILESNRPDEKNIYNVDLRFNGDDEYQVEYLINFGIGKQKTNSLGLLKVIAKVKKNKIKIVLEGKIIKKTSYNFIIKKKNTRLLLRIWNMGYNSKTWYQEFSTEFIEESYNKNNNRYTLEHKKIKDGEIIFIGNACNDLIYITNQINMSITAKNNFSIISPVSNNDHDVWSIKYYLIEKDKIIFSELFKNIVSITDSEKNIVLKEKNEKNYYEEKLNNKIFIKKSNIKIYIANSL